MKTATLVLALAALMAAAPATACTLCHSPGAAAVRHQLLHADLVRNAAAVAAPIPLLLAMILFAAGGPARRSARDA
ncbi:hypothetical protein [Phenylobacterium sp.]|uniref:hypothetical protein n=1 Tax=Phenylobacterium sp. TaxID=1871053 RepID=UPI002DEB9D2F|nr:hypothetical protein [Phenylobacterium sp.]